MVIFPGIAQVNSKHEVKMLILQFFMGIGMHSPLTNNAMVWPKGAKIVDSAIADLVLPLVRLMENRVQAFSGNSRRVSVGSCVNI